jgi:hypothetical protein
VPKERRTQKNKDLKKKRCENKDLKTGLKQENKHVK